MSLKKMLIFLGAPLILNFALPGAAVAQKAETAAIRQQVERFFEATQQKNWEAVLDLTYPGLFEIAPREDLLQLFQNMEGDGMTFSFRDMKMGKMSPVTTAGEEQFARVEYSSVMTIHLQGDQYEDQQTIDLMRAGFEQAFGAGNVTYSASDNTFEVISEKVMIAVAGKGKKDWKFIEYDPARQEMLQQILPAEILEKFDKK